MSSEQRDLFTALARKTDPETSHAAAKSLDDEHIARLEREVARAIQERGGRGATWDELHTLTGIDKASISPRFKPLRDKGIIEWRLDGDGKPIKRPGWSGRGQIVWFCKVSDAHRTD